ncbi:glycosyltransferase [Salinisphaera sp. T31B1]|uniref:glycosyltransferase n=1 Tax=Salinisphaera sp. T31B1 TaxID=727963 RepID=UPI0033413C31
MNNPRITLVLTTYNRADLLVEALESIGRSIVGDHVVVEVIVVDNNSTDDTATQVERVIARGFPFELRYVFEAEQGLSAARNRGTAEARGSIVVFMDDDQRIAENYLADVELVFEESGAQCVGGPLLYYNATQLPKWLPHLLQYIGQFDAGPVQCDLTPDGELLRGGNMAILKKDLVALGGYDTRLGRRGELLFAKEETDLQERLYAAGGRIAYDPRLIQYHFLRPERYNKNYWRRNRFDWGRTTYQYENRSETVTGGDRLGGVPRWYLRYLLTRDLPRYVKAWANRNAGKRFDRELDIWLRLGRIYEARKLGRSTSPETE